MSAGNASSPIAQLEALGLETAALGAPDYASVREALTWNKRLVDARAPRAIVRPRSAEQVAAAIRLARRHDLRVAVRGSGHSYFALFLRDGGLLLDLSALDSLELDEDSRTAVAGPGVRGGDMLERLAQRGLAFPVGHCGDVALGGYLLSGGIGWNYAEWGPACGLVSGIEAVTADGEIVHASADEHPDLFWAARGGGAGFCAAVTRFELALRPLPPAACVWTATFAAEAAPILPDWLDVASGAAHPGAELVCPVGPDFRSGRPSISVRAIATGGDAEEARARIASFRSPPGDAKLLFAISEEVMRFTDLPRFSAMPSDMRVAADQCWTAATLGQMVLAVHELAGEVRAPSTINIVAPGGPGPSPHLAAGSDSAFSVGGGSGAGIYAMWDDPAEDDLHLRWVRRADAALAPLRAGRYVGEADLAASPGRVEECFTPDALHRLARVRARYDPGGLFFGFPEPDREA